MACSTPAKQRVKGPCRRIGPAALAGLLAILVPCSLLLLPSVTRAQTRAEPDDDRSAKSREESEVRLPAMPKAENLLQFDSNIAGGNRYFVDAESISVGDDRSVRYTLVVRSPSGVDNVSYEGLRCETAEQRYYAFGRRDGTWVSPRSSEWRPIDAQGANHPHRELHRQYFCPVGGAVKTAKDAVNRLKYGVPPGTPPGGNGR